jgi:hypothetical protein
MYLFTARNIFPQYERFFIFNQSNGTQVIRRAAQVKTTLKRPLTRNRLGGGRGPAAEGGLKRRLEEEEGEGEETGRRHEEGEGMGRRQKEEANCATPPPPPLADVRRAIHAAGKKYIWNWKER